MMMRRRISRLAGSLVLLAMACAPNEAAGPRQAPDSDRPAPAAPTPQAREDAPSAPEPAGPTVRLRWGLNSGDAWEERMTDRMFVLEHPKDAFDPTVPLSSTTQTERFEVADANDRRARLTTTITDLRLEIRHDDTTTVFDSGDPPSPSIDRLAATRLAYVDVPLKVSLSSVGAVERVHGVEERRAAVLGRFDTLAASLSEDDRRLERDQLLKELENLESSLRERGVRPPLPEEPVGVGSRWAQTMQLPSLMDSTVRYGLTYTVSAIEEDEVQVQVKGTGTLDPSPAMAMILETSEFRIEGVLRLDPRDGVLLEHREDLRMKVVFREHPMIGEGGTMASRIERRRVRNDAKAE